MCIISFLKKHPISAGLEVQGLWSLVLCSLVPGTVGRGVAGFAETLCILLQWLGLPAFPSFPRGEVTVLQTAGFGGGGSILLGPDSDTIVS